MDSILNSIKKLLGIDEAYTHFDEDLIMHINSVFMILTQLGVGPPTGFRIEGEFTTWNDFIDEENDIPSIRSYIYQKVKLMFDPPLSSAVMECMNRTISEFEWRLNVAAETPKPKEEEVF